jgi:DNA-binding transcriptional MerR regulator/methylmalonyl-CoA mutase cobalamin-binding subunit
MSDTIHSIKAVARQTGLSPHVIRIWEKRYQAVTPSRTDTHRRLYSDQEIQRLILLRNATAAGHSIGNVARLSDERLRELAARPSAAAAAESAPAVEPSAADTAAAPQNPAEIIDAAIKATSELDAAALERVLARASVTLGHRGLLQKVVAPLAHRVGELWAQGVFKICHEHLASAVIRTLLANSVKLQSPHPSAPTVVVSTPAGQIHELGAAMVAAGAAHIGWRVTYLGPNLPANEIAAAVEQSNARAVALSMVYPEDDPTVDEELQLLRRLLPTTVSILVGGRASAAYRNTLQRIGAVIITDLNELYAQLELIRRQGPPGKPANGRNN